MPVVTIAQQTNDNMDHTSKVESICKTCGGIYTDMGIKSNNHSASIPFKKFLFSNTDITWVMK